MLFLFMGGGEGKSKKFLLKGQEKLVNMDASPDLFVFPYKVNGEVARVTVNTNFNLVNKPFTSEFWKNISKKGNRYNK